MNRKQYDESKYLQDLPEIAGTLHAIRSDKDKPTDVTLEEYLKEKYQIGVEAFYDDLGVEPQIDTIQNLVTLPDQTVVRFLYNEVIRDAIRLGLKRNTIWPDLVMSEVSVPNPTITQPWINTSDATPRKVGEAETIGTGTVSFGKKQLSLTKLGKGIKVSYEVTQYVTLDVVGIFIQDFGVKLGLGLDALMIDVLINGEQADLSESAPVIGITTANTLTYRDLLRVWVRMSRIGRRPQAILGGEDAALDMLDLDEFKLRAVGTPHANLNLKTPVPNSTDFYVHGSVPADQLLVVDKNAAIIKYNAQPLLLETEKIVSNQTIATYATLTTGFGSAFRDGRIVIDTTSNTVTFPDEMDVDALEAVTFD